MVLFWPSFHSVYINFQSSWDTFMDTISFLEKPDDDTNYTYFFEIFYYFLWV